MSFEDLNLTASVYRAIQEEGYETPSPIQAAAIPIVMEGHDLMGCAQTGTGKTAAFALPTLNNLGDAPEHLRKKPNYPPRNQQRGRGRNGRGGNRGPKRTPDRPIRALVLTPTRELAVQVAESFRTYGRFTGLRNTVLFGGVSQNPQVDALQTGVDILVATPGRLLDLMNQGHVDLKNIEVLILDEADQMLDMGFLPDLKKIVAATPKERQTLMFSATMPDEIRKLASMWLRNPKRVEVTPVSSAVETVKQSVFMVDKRHKPQMLTHYLSNTPCGRTLVFSRTKHGADKIVKHLGRAGLRAASIHGNKSQGARTRTLDQFKSKRPPILVATDIAARGLDVDSVTHVINYDLPDTPEVYVHRIGRTGRAGASGEAVSFCGGDERGHLKRIERLIKRAVEVDNNKPKFTNPQPAPKDESSRDDSPAGGQRRGKFKGNGSGGGKGKPKGKSYGGKKGAAAHSGKPKKKATAKAEGSGESTAVVKTTDKPAAEKPRRKFKPKRYTGERGGSSGNTQRPKRKGQKQRPPRKPAASK